MTFSFLPSGAPSGGRRLRIAVVPGLTALSLAAFGVPFTALVLPSEVLAACNVGEETVSCVGTEPNGVIVDRPGDLNVKVGPSGNYVLVQNGMRVETYDGDVEFFVEDSGNPNAVVDGYRVRIENIANPNSRTPHGVEIVTTTGNVNFVSDGNTVIETQDGSGDAPEYVGVRYPRNVPDGEGGFLVVYDYQGGDTIHIVTGSGNVTVDNSSDLFSAGRGIYVSSGIGDIVIDNDGTVESDAEGIRTSTSGAGTIDITNRANISAETGSGIFARTENGAIEIDNTAEIAAPSEGISASSDAGSITITNSGEIESGADAIYAETVGPIEITNSANLNAGYDGISAYGEDGAIKIINSGDIEANNDGIYADADTGAIEINNSGDIVADGIGINALSGNSNLEEIGATITIFNTGNIASSEEGIYAETMGADISITNDGTIGQPGVDGLIPDSGIVADATGYGYFYDTEDEGEAYGAVRGGDVLITHNGAIIASDVGIYARTWGEYREGTEIDAEDRATVRIVTGAESVIIVGQDSDEDSDGYGIEVEVDGYADVDLQLGGLIDADDDGVEISADLGDVTFDLKNTGVIVAQNNAIDVEGGKNINGTVSGQIYARQSGVEIGDEPSENVDLTIRGNILAGRRGIQINQTITADVTIDAGGLVIGNLSGRHYAAIEIDASGSGKLTNYGQIEALRRDSEGSRLDVLDTVFDSDGNYVGLSSDDIPSGHADGLAIRLGNFDPAENPEPSEEEEVEAAIKYEIDNYGTIIGRLEAADGTTVIFNNMSANTWEFTGDSKFDGEDELVNDGFSDGADDVVNNGFFDGEGYTRGTIKNAVDGSISEQAQYLGLETFNNAYGTLTLRDQDAGDTFRQDRVFISGDFNGADADEADQKSLIELDAFLGNADPDSTRSDQVFIGGNTSGLTLVSLNDVNLGFAGLVADGIPVIAVGEASNGQFRLVNGPMVKGLYTFDLFEKTSEPMITVSDVDDSETPTNFNPENYETLWVLASYVNESVHNLAAIPHIATNTWHATTEGWQQRSGDLRTYFSGGAPLSYADTNSGRMGYQSQDSGIWGRIIGYKGERSDSFDVGVLDVTIGFDAGYSETYIGGEAGIDRAFHTDMGTIVLGALGGYGTNDIAFNNGDAATLSGPSVGAYADWLSGTGSYVSALFKADFLTLDYALASDGDLDASTNGVTLGGMLEAGHRFDADGLFFEPVASIAYANTTFDDFSIGDDVVGLEGESLRARAGGRIGATIATEAAIISPFVSAFVGNEFLGSANADLSSTTLAGRTDDFTGIYGEVGAGINIEGIGNGFTAFANGTYIVSEDYEAGRVTGGLRSNF